MEDTKLLIPHNRSLDASELVGSSFPEWSAGTGDWVRRVVQPDLRPCTARNCLRAPLRIAFDDRTRSPARGYMPWPEASFEGATDAQKAVLEPPYHPRMNRPYLTSKAECREAKKRESFKIEFDEKVFGSRYF